MLHALQPLCGTNNFSFRHENNYTAEVLIKKYGVWYMHLYNKYSWSLQGKHIHHMRS